MKSIAGVEVREPIHYETPTGGEIIIGKCMTDSNHLIVFAHIEVHEAGQLAEALNEAMLKYGKTEGEA